MGFMGAVAGFVCGGGIAVGLFFAGKSWWPAEGTEGSCQVTNSGDITFECVGGKGRSFKLNMANVTFEDGTKRICNTFWLTDNCGLLGSSEPAEVLNGDARPCQWFETEVSLPTFGTAPAGACIEPGHLGGVKAGAIMLWVLAAGLFCCCCCGGILTSAKGETEDGGGLSGDEDGLLQ
eukprot:gnl/TRDRNA2_/TRDRNA2_167818_c0_seq3.p2 gnl/TRDRNA2_/TRDRNA2_167818_c0~~gnl/TRDRNA2_/TRDRNA2_167818_c0_seq3.p2  ORF type:complete len:178 (-),score=20.07 gnl/TRDRNA2_/TRDRNA2_167818_c0_seq3:71-604(-)